MLGEAKRILAKNEAKLNKAAEEEEWVRMRAE